MSWTRIGSGFPAHLGRQWLRRWVADFFGGDPVSAPSDHDRWLAGLSWVCSDRWLGFFLVLLLVAWCWCRSKWVVSFIGYWSG